MGNQRSAPTESDIIPSETSLLYQPLIRWRIEPILSTADSVKRPADGRLKVMLMPADHSCLFHAISYVCDGMQTDAKHAKIQRLRVAQHIRLQRQLASSQIPKTSSAATYSDAVLNMSLDSYLNYVTQETSWGSSIELQAFSEIYQTEIFVMDLQGPHCYLFGEQRHYARRVYLLYSNNHYDAICWKPSASMKKTLPADRRKKAILEAFSPLDIGMLQNVKYVVERLATYYQQQLEESEKQHGYDERMRYKLVETSWKLAKRDKATVTRLEPSKFKGNTLDRYLPINDRDLFNAAANKYKAAMSPAKKRHSALNSIVETREETDAEDDSLDELSRNAPSTRTYSADLTLAAPNTPQQSPSLRPMIRSGG